MSSPCSLTRQEQIHLIHEQAIIEEGAIIGNNVTIGPWTYVSKDVVIGDDCHISANVVINGPTTIGKGNRIFQFASIGEDCQDLKYAGEPTELIIGDNNVFRESCTIHRGTIQDQGITQIGNNNLFMAYTHVAHDCAVGNHVTMANGASLAGHVRLDDYAILGGFTLVHQFTKIGRLSFSAMGSAITQDVPPFVMVGGRPTRPHGINSVGMERSGCTPEVTQQIRRAYKILYKSNLKLEDAIDEMEEIAGECTELSHMVNFLRNVTRGILR